MNLNKVMLIGRVTREPEIKSLPSGVKVCSFSLATNRTWKNKDGEKMEETDFHNLVAFGRTAETIAQYVVKGQLLYCEGRNKTRSWEDKESGKKVYRTEVMLDSFQFGPKPGNAAKRPEEVEDEDLGGEPGDPDIDPEDIPF